MSATSPSPAFDPGPVRPWWKDSSGLTEYLREVSLFLRDFRSRLRVGEHSRSPLRFIRFQLDQGTIWCDWIARDPDPWDSALPVKVGRRHAALQTLKDAIDTRALIFRRVHGVDHAFICVYRLTPENFLEAVIFGNLRRDEGSFRYVHSLAMRAKLLGFRFKLEDEVLHALRPADQI